VAPGDLDEHRQALLDAARDVVGAARRADVDPDHVVDHLVVGWGRLAGPAPTFDDEFHPDPATGVEALAFVVRAAGGVRAGLVLRLAGELPDSFEPLDGELPALATPADVRQAYFASDPRA
jgi:hypothetical protein